MAARIVKIAKTLRNHWKKSTAAAILAGWGIHFGHDRYRANILREEFCRQAQVYGQQTIKYATEKPRKITVILNPAARNGKAKKLFEKNAAPILNLAGIDVVIIKTESEGNGKEKAAGLESTDAVVVAGGDGTVGEVITGLLRREDEAAVSVRWPLGVIPVGTTNTLARFLYGSAEMDVRWMGNAAMAVIRGVTEPIDVMAIQGEDGRNIFTVNTLEWGPLKEAKELSTKYWYLGPLKQKMAYIFASLTSDWPQVLSASIQHRPAVEEPEPVPETPARLGIDWWSWVQRLFPWTRAPTTSEEPSTNSDDKETDPEEEIQWTDLDVVTTEMTVATGNTDEVKMTPRALRLTTGPSELSRIEFIKEGWRRVESSQEDGMDAGHYKTQTAEVGEVRLRPALQEGKETFYVLDNEKLEAQPITVTLLPKKLRFFTDRPDRDSVIGPSQST